MSNHKLTIVMGLVVLSIIKILVTYLDGETRTMTVRENSGDFPSLLTDHGANRDQLNPIQFRYVGSGDGTAIWRGLLPLVTIGIGYYCFVMWMVYRLRRRVQDDVARAIWASVILAVPVFGLIAYVVATRPVSAKTT